MAAHRWPSYFHRTNWTFNTSASVGKVKMHVIIFRPYFNIEGKSSTQCQGFSLHLLANFPGRMSGPNDFEFQIFFITKLLQICS